MNWNPLASKDIRRERTRICEACPVFVSSTRSCGTIGIAAVRKKSVTVRGKTFSPCGCQVDLKILPFSLTSCPGGFWGSEYMSTAEKLELKKYLQANWEKSFDLNDLRKWGYKAMKQKLEISNCRDCVIKLRDDLWNMVKDVDVPLYREPRQRGPKKKNAA